MLVGRGQPTMNKTYSNKALPAGTVLREWRLEEVLGVGGFGIVYKARGIYFDELVAIKEYFPSSISDRDSEDTVVPIDSDAEEVHALGLKKFVEEAKLLWNLSTPTRHPNIVSVRSLFEIHGTAYMVMDFEDGISLSRMLKQGRRFNERSLWNILRPIAQGLDRAHRVGVLHRDIKPPNILINEDNRPVLIDFGSARFTTAEATSTNVTFHTPPYAAIEQYVKTYEQGPWTDIYALGVVLYECVTGEKPPEVLERLHAGLGNPLAGGKWPGYSKKFLSAIDAAMVVKPDERPQSISEWLSTFGKSLEEDTDTDDGSEDATRFISKQVESEEIIPVGTTDAANLVDTGVPNDPKQVKFKRIGRETTTSKKVAAPEPAGAEAEGNEDEAADTENKAAAVVAAKPAKAPKKPVEAKEPGAKSKTPMLIGGAAVLLLAGIGGAAMFMRGGSSDQSTVNALATDTGGNADIILGNGSPDANAVAENAGMADAQNAVVPTGEETTDQASADALRKEQAKAKAAEAKLAAAQKAQAKLAAAQKGAAAATASKTAAGKSTATSSAAASAAESSSGGVSSAKLSQFYGIVDSARSMAKQVMRSGNSQNAQLARSYDANLKTLRDSIRGVNSDRDADRLIKQATQTRAYVQFLVKQSQ
jgi:serine/threonine protein kinase